MLATILLIFCGCLLLERLVPGWPLPRVKTWPLRVLLVNAVQLGVVLLAGVSWEIWLSSWSVFRLSDHVSPAAGGFIAYFIATFVFYWWHRWRHEIDLLWLGFHQIHHSPRRLEVITSFYKHPGEMIVNSRHRVGSVLCFSVRKCTAYIINSTGIKITMAISSGGTCSSAPMKIPNRGNTAVDLPRNVKKGWWTCSPIGMFMKKPDR